MVVVIDTTTFISAFRYGGTPRDAIVKAATEDTIALSDLIEAEIVRVLESKFGVSRDETVSQIEEYFPDAIRIEIDGSVTGICRDPLDDHIIECAVKCSASFVITGDKDLLTLGTYKRIHFITARQYVGGESIATGRGV